MSGLRWFMITVFFTAIFVIPARAKSEKLYSGYHTTSETASITANDLDVIEAVARAVNDEKHFFPTKGKTILAVQIESRPGELKSGVILPGCLMDDAVTTPAVINWRERNKRTFAIPKRVQRGDVVILGSREYNEMAAKGTIDKEFPEIHDVIFMWLPGYDKKDSEAVVYYFVSWGDEDWFDGAGYVRQVETPGKEMGDLSENRGVDYVSEV